MKAQQLINEIEREEKNFDFEEFKERTYPKIYKPIKRKVLIFYRNGFYVKFSNRLDTNRKQLNLNKKD